MKKTLINIWAYNHHAKFSIEHVEDTPELVNIMEKNVERVARQSLNKRKKIIDYIRGES